VGYNSVADSTGPSTFV